MSMKGTRYPYRISLGNFRLIDRREDAGSRVNIQRTRHVHLGKWFMMSSSGQQFIVVVLKL